MAEEPQEPDPLPTEPPRFILAPYKTPWERAQERFRVEQERFQGECERAAHPEDYQEPVRELMARVGRAAWPRYYFF